MHDHTVGRQLRRVANARRPSIVIRIPQESVSRVIVRWRASPPIRCCLHPASSRQSSLLSVLRRVGHTARAAILDGGPNQKGRGTREHDDDRHDRPPSRNLPAEHHDGGAEEDRGTEQVATPPTHALSLRRRPRHRPESPHCVVAQACVVTQRGMSIWTSRGRVPREMDISRDPRHL